MVNHVGNSVFYEIVEDGPPMLVTSEIKKVPAVRHIQWKDQINESDDFVDLQEKMPEKRPEFESIDLSEHIFDSTCEKEDCETRNSFKEKCAVSTITTLIESRSEDNDNICKIWFWMMIPFFILAVTVLISIMIVCLIKIL